MEEALKDERFSHILTDSRFRKMPKNIRKVTVDKRFKGMFKDKMFKGKCMFDKRGRPLDLKPSENLKQLYDISSGSSENDDEEEGEENKNRKNKAEKEKIEIAKPFPRETNPDKISAKAMRKGALLKKTNLAAESCSDQKVTTDKRFKGMFKDKNFKGKCIFDKQGQPLDLKPSENLKQLDDTSSESGENDDAEEGEENKNRKNKVEKEKKIEITKPLPREINPDKISSKAMRKSALLKKTNLAAESCSDQKVTNDKRFKGMFKDKNFKGKCIFDKQGQPLDLKPSENFKQLDDTSSESDENDDAEEGEENKNEMNKVEKKKKIEITKPLSEKISSKATLKESAKKTNSTGNCCDQKVNDSVQISEDEESSSSEDASDKDSSEESDDSDDSDSDDSSGDISDDFDHQWEELRNDAPDTNEITRRIAVCNMDWDRIRAEDLFACFNSFKPADGSINSVKIYPSEFGLKRMEEESIQGPSELVEKTLPLNKEEPEDKKGSKYHREKLRQYQINRLKYFYAVVDCDSPETANAVYEQLNGMEYESSSVRFDLRFIPDDVTFDHEPTSIADKVPDPTEYKPRLFVTAALQQVKVNLTWDETDPKRREIFQRAFTEPESIEKDIKEYLASSSGESEEDEEENVEEASSKKKLSVKDRIAKYKELLLSLEENEKEEKTEYEMEITWEPGLKEKTEEIVKEKMKKDNLNPFEEIIQKKKNERKLKRKEQKMKQADSSVLSDENSDEELFSKKTESKDQDSKRLAELALISDSKKESNFVNKANKKDKKFKKNKSQKEDDLKIDVNDFLQSDPRFSAIYSSHSFNIDPSAPQFKDSELNRAMIREKQRKLKLTGFQDSNRNTKKARYS